MSDLQSYNSSHARESGFDPEGRGYRSPPLHRSALRSPRSPSTSALPDTHHPRYPTSTHPPEEPLLSPTRGFPTYVHNESSRGRRSSSGAAPMNGTSSREEIRQGLLSPPAKHAPIPPIPNQPADDQVMNHANLANEQYAAAPRSGAMSISSLLVIQPFNSLPHHPDLSDGSHQWTSPPQIYLSSMPIPRNGKEKAKSLK